LQASNNAFAYNQVILAENDSDLQKIAKNCDMLIHYKIEIPEEKSKVVGMIGKRIVLNDIICILVLDSLYVRKIGIWKKI
jgi:hypothetical protein